MMDTSESDGCHKLGSSVKQVDEKHAFSEMREMVWSPKMDLVVAVTLSEPNDIILYRLHALKKMWSHSPPTENSKVTSVAWDPLGRCIAVAYSTEQVIILAVEKAGVLYTHTTSSVPTNLLWLAIDKVKAKSAPLYNDISAKMLPDIPSVYREDESHPSVSQINQEGLNYLIVSGETGIVNVYVYGLLSIAYINLQTFCPEKCKVLSSCLSTTGSYLVSVTEDDNSNLSLASLNTEFLSARSEEIQIVAKKFVLLTSLLEHCDFSVSKMVEAWEDGLLELESKLNHFSTQKQLIGEGTVLNDFLELLLFGTPSEELKAFLMKDLTERGMKKLGQSLQTYYKTMQELLTVNMQGAVESMFYHLNDLYGLSQWSDTFGVIGLSSEHIEEAIQACASLRLKINEMLHLIGTGNRNFKEFSAWLFTVILRISEQTVPAAAAEPNFIAVAEFLNENFQGLEEHGSRIRLERVGQYLKDCDLTSPPKPSEKSLWTKMEKYPHLAASKLIFKSEPTKSLYQLYKILAIKIREALTTPSLSIIKTMSMGIRKRLTPKCELRKLRQFSVQREDDTSCVYTVRLAKAEGDNSNLTLVASRLSTDCASTSLSQSELIFGLLGHRPSLYSCGSHRIIDFDYYKNEDIVVLLQQTEGENFQSYLTVRLNLMDLGPEDWSADSLVPVVDVGQHVSPSYIKVLENAANALQISVSGNRDIGGVMLSSRRVRLFMYDVDEDSDDEENTSHNLTSAAAADDSTFGSDKENINI